MRFRQIHLDFHTSEAIGNIGVNFTKAQFQEMLKTGHIDSITVFSKCHHGWAYHPSKANEMHPGLKFDLLGAMIEAAHEINVKTPVYISAGLDEKLARRQPNWLVRNKEEQTTWVPNFMTPGYHRFCMNSPYLDVLTAQIEEVVQNYDTNGLFLDIVGIQECYCQYCVASIRKRGKDPRDTEAMKLLWDETYQEYARRTNEAAHKHVPGLHVFHNNGHIVRGRRDLARLNSHLEVESLPTGGWGYDHFPLSARYVQTLGIPFLGMTGKFHTMWGEFGGFKHPNALRYETALSLANGARCSIGDQLHPEGIMDEATYKLIGEAYSEVEKREEWAADTCNIADIALLSLESIGAYESIGTDLSSRSGASDSGAVRMLLEGKFLFDVIDLDADFNQYKVIILPDKARIDARLQAKLDDFFQKGGKVFASGTSGLSRDGNQFALDLGVKFIAEDEYQPSYFKPHFKLEHLGNTSFVMYSKGQQIELAGGTELGHRENPYFNRDIFTFCSHMHTPSTLKPAGPAMVEGKQGIYFAWNVFEEYSTKGSLVLKEAVNYALNRLLPNKTLTTNLPAQGIVTLQEQRQQNRWVQHNLYASAVRRGKDVEIIEDLPPIYDVGVSVAVPQKAARVYLAPELTELPFEQKDGTISYSIPKLHCHQMVVIQF